MFPIVPYTKIAQMFPLQGQNEHDMLKNLLTASSEALGQIENNFA